MYKMTIIGNLTEDPVTNEREWVNKKTGEIIKNKVSNFTVAANEGYGDYKSTEYIKVNAWRGLSEIVSKYLVKGRQVYIEGVPHINNYVDKNNNVHFSFQINAERIELLQDGKHIKAAEESAPSEEALY